MDFAIVSLAGATVNVLRLIFRPFLDFHDLIFPLVVDEADSG